MKSPKWESNTHSPSEEHAEPSSKQSSAADARLKSKKILIAKKFFKEYFLLRIYHRIGIDRRLCSRENCRWCQTLLNYVDFYESHIMGNRHKIISTYYKMNPNSRYLSNDSWAGKKLKMMNELLTILFHDVRNARQQASLILSKTESVFKGLF
jgi:hypothetical protein